MRKNKTVFVLAKRTPNAAPPAFAAKRASFSVYAQKIKNQTIIIVSIYKSCAA